MRIELGMPAPPAGLGLKTAPSCARAFISFTTNETDTRNGRQQPLATTATRQTEQPAHEDQANRTSSSQITSNPK